jgi:hypothetical protein
MYVLICFFRWDLRNPFFISRLRYSYMPRILRSSRFYGSNMLGVFICLLFVHLMALSISDYTGMPVKGIKKKLKFYFTVSFPM